MTPAGIATHLEHLRDGFDRLTPDQVADAITEGALVIDTRTESHRRDEGEFPGAIVIDRTVLEWRLDPTSPNHIPEMTDGDRPLIVICRHGYSSSLAAASLRAIGLRRATDMIGGVRAWQAAGYPMTADPADVRP